METKKLEMTKLQAKIFRFLCENSGEEINQSLLAKSLKVSPTAVSKSLIQLEKEELINVDRNKTMNLNKVSLNRENPLAIQLKRTENLSNLYKSRILEFLEENFPGTTLILFGSYSKGEDIKKSDIDLAIIGTKEKELDLTKFEKELNKEIIINFYPSIKMLEKELKENLFNGIVLYGGVEI